MIRRVIDTLAFTGLVVVGCIWSVTAFGQPIFIPPSNASTLSVLTASNSATTGGASVTLAGSPGRVTFLCGFMISPGAATAAITISINVSNLASGGFALSVGAPVAAAGTTAATVSQTFTPCVPAFAAGQGVGVSVGALGTGGVNQTVNAWGYQY